MSRSMAAKLKIELPDPHKYKTSPHNTYWDYVWGSFQPYMVASVDQHYSSENICIQKKGHKEQGTIFCNSQTPLLTTNRDDIKKKRAFTFGQWVNH